MKDQLQKRLDELKQEFETGQNRLRALETEQARLNETMLRISGAIQVLEEALADVAEPAEEPVGKTAKG